MVTGWPTADGSGRSDVMVVVVFALFTECAVAGVETLPVKFASPAYEAKNVFAPGVGKVMEQLPAATVPVQLCVPSETVTIPPLLGVPLPGATAATL